MKEKKDDDLQDNSVLSADIAQGAYDGRPNSFTHGELDKGDHKKLDNGESVKVRVNPDNESMDLYLQPTPDDTITEDGHEGLFQDPKSGFSAYLLTDTETLNDDTKNVYIAVRGSDGFSAKTLNDWVNNFDFTMGNGYTKQAQETKAAISDTISNMRSKSPNAKLNLSGHSLGTINTIEALSQLSEEELEHIGSVDLYDGPDATDAIQNLDPENLKKLKKIESKINYYVNPFDLVSMLNRHKGPQIGNVHYIVPVDANGTMGDQFLKGNKNVSAHNLGQIQTKRGKVVVATMASNPELFLAGKKLANLIDQKKGTLGEILTDARRRLGIPQKKFDELVGMLEKGEKLSQKEFVELLIRVGLNIYLYNVIKLYHDYENALKTINGFQNDYKQICQDAQDVRNHEPLRADYAKELQKFRKDWIVKLRKKFKASGGGLSTNEKIYLRQQEALFATQRYRELMFGAADEAGRAIEGGMKSVEKVWPATVKKANDLGPDLSENERLSALEEGGATKTTVERLINQRLQSDLNEINAGKKVYEDFIASVEKSMKNLLAKDKELAQQIEAAEQP